MRYDLTLIGLFTVSLLSACGSDDGRGAPNRTNAVEKAENSEPPVPFAKLEDIRFEDGAQTVGTDTLLLEIPDGVRGGIGNIQSTWPGEGEPLPFVEAFERCGGTKVSYQDAPTHREYITGYIEKDALEVVRCIQRNTQWHFRATVYRSPKKASSE